MDPKSCRQTPHWIIAMICSLSSYFDLNIQPQFCLLKMCFWAECFMFCWWLHQQLVRSEAPGVYSAGEYSLILKHNVEYCPVLIGILCASLEALISVLNTASGAPFEELLCVRRWRWCRGGAVLVAEGHGWKEGGYFTFLQSHTWLSSLQVCSTLGFSLLLKNIMKERTLLFRVAAHRHWPPVVWGNTYQPMISQNNNKKKKTYRCQPSENDR